MRLLLTTLSFSLLVSVALAQERPLVTEMTCSRAEALVASQGAVVLSTGPTTYDRFVRDGSYCMVGEAPVAARVPTVESAYGLSCFIGFRCGGISKGGG